jgi:NADPH:quinone reductase-like Zn-dependent oxidoreductase
MSATNGRGVDVILNSLTGDMLDESFRILADGGILVEIGKKDILDRNGLAMEPFDRNISFRGVDMSHQRVSDPLISRYVQSLSPNQQILVYVLIVFALIRLLKTMFELLEARHIRPIMPMHVFSFEDVPNAIRFIRAGKHIGKIVISSGPDAKVTVPVSLVSCFATFSNDVY